jgi:uncharacterized protein (DUF952 family)
LDIGRDFNKQMTPLDVAAPTRHIAGMIYKILRSDEWTALQAKGETPGAPIDVADGYVHFSTAAQVRETATKHFAGVEGLMLVAYDENAITGTLRWEPSRGGALFPHLYAPLRLSDAVWTKPLPLGGAGHVFPDDLA